MTTTQQLKRGMKVQFTVGPLGCLDAPDAFRFGVGIVKQGDTGRYYGPHSGHDMADWHMIAVNLGGRDVFVPCHESQFEALHD